MKNHAYLDRDGNEIVKSVFVPRYYDPEIARELEEVGESEKTEFVKIGKLVRDGVIAIRKGHEIGAQHYGSGEDQYLI